MRTGYRLALGVASITIVLALVLLVVELFGSTRDPGAYGQVSLPGRESLTLPQGDVIIFYGEASGTAGSSPRVPPNLRLRVRTASGQLLLGTTPFLTDPFEHEGHTWRGIAKLRVPEGGNYEAVSSSREPGAADPALGFGHTGSRSFGYVLFVVAGGLLLAAILAVATRVVRRF
jgi:hypothetical protein